MSHLVPLSTLCRTTQQLGLEDDLDALLGEILQHARALIGFDCCALLLHEPQSGQLVARHALGFQRDVTGLCLEIGEGICGLAAARRHPVREGDVDASQHYVPGLEAARSNMAVPLVLENQLVGVINVESPCPDAFTEEHEMFLTVLGTQAALAIVAARAQQELKRKLSHLEALYRISALATAKRSFAEVLTGAIEEAEKGLPMGELAILLVDEDRRHLVVRHGGGFADHVEGMRVPIERGIAGRCACTGKAQLVDDVRRDPDYIRGVEGARSQLAVPLFVEGEVDGVLIAESRTPAAYAPDDLNFASAIAAEIASVLHASRLKEEAERLAVTDPLTGLANRRHFQDRTREALQAAERYGDDIGLLVLDLDHFKEINDTHGHPAGDEVLRGVARRLDGIARAGDLVARIGGEEFAILLRECGPERSRAAAARILSELRLLRVDLDRREDLKVTASIGIATYPGSGRSFDDLFAAADTALYRAKNEGRDRVVFDSAVESSSETARPRAAPPRQAARSA